jgi:uncharacterized protein YegL
MNKNLTEIVLVVDRSGSMYSCQADAECGINSFIKEQKELDGDANFTLVQFDTEYDFVCEGVDINKVEDYSLVPRGGTALLDAVGRAMQETGERLNKLDESEKPGLVVFVIVTDGEENSSREFTVDQIKEMIGEQTDKYSWQFTFLGAGLDAFAGGANMGIAAGATAMYDVSKTAVAYAASSANVGRMRKMSASGYNVTNEYTEEELKSMS